MLNMKMGDLEAQLLDLNFVSKKMQPLQMAIFHRQCFEAMGRKEALEAYKTYLPLSPDSAVREC